MGGSARRSRASVPSGRSAARRGSLSAQVVSTVREWIAAGDMVPGELYSAYQLAESLELSRSPVREGLLRLEEAGTIIFERNRGFRVVVPAPREIAEIFAVRLALEVPAAGQAAARAGQRAHGEITAAFGAMSAALQRWDERGFARHDRAFHDALLCGAGNERARAIVHGLRDAIEAIGASTVGSTRGLAEIHHEHGPILDAVTTGDRWAAEEAMRAHLARTGRLLVQQGVRAHGSGTDPGQLWADVVG